MPIRQPAEAFEMRPSLAGPDMRADGAARRVAFDRDHVAISRRYLGIDMRVRVPVSAYRGVALVAGDEHGFELQLVHRDAELSVTLERAAEHGEAVAGWRSWARRLGVPALAELRAEPPTAAAPVTTCFGGPAASMARRRPRFLQHRKTGQAERMLLVHRAERESGDDAKR